MRAELRDRYIEFPKAALIAQTKVVVGDPHSAVVGGHVVDGKASSCDGHDNDSRRDN